MSIRNTPKESWERRVHKPGEADRRRVRTGPGRFGPCGFHLGAAVALFSVALLFPIGGCPGRPADGGGETEDASFHNGDTTVDVEIALSRIGVLAREGVDASQLSDLTAALKLASPEEVTEGLFVYETESPLRREELFNLARNLVEMGGNLVVSAGLVATTNGAEKPMILTDSFIAEFRPGTTQAQVETINADNNVTIVMENPFVDNQFLLRVNADSPRDSLATANLYAESELTAFAHPNFLMVTERRQFVPNDPLFGNQWHHVNSGAPSGTADADIDSDWAWDITRGAAGTLIAVVDGGFDMTHPDLLPNYWTNPGEIAGNGIDDDGNGFVDDVNGWDFTGCVGAPGAGCGDNNPTGPDTGDGRHGTSVAGTAAAAGNNLVGVSGSCPNCTIMPLRISGLVTSANSQALTFGYAQQMGAAIITNSWGYPIGTAIPVNVRNAINAAATAGRGGLGSVVLWAMNNPSNNDCVGATPDLSSLANVIAVSRSTNQDQFDFSGFGNCMDVLAPTAGRTTVTAGRGTLWATTTDMQGAAGYNNNATDLACPSAEAPPPPANARDYTFCFGGTSFATPLTAGIVGLMLTVNPNLSRLEVQQLLQDTADRIEDSTGAYSDVNGFSTPASGQATHGWGRVNAFEAVRVAAPKAQGGRGGVDIFLRDNRLDWGNTEQPSNTLFEPTRGFIAHWKSVDIKVDAPPLEAAPPATSAGFDAFVHENAASGAMNRVYVRVRNRGPVDATNVTVKLHWAFAGAGLPALPADFWTAFPDDSSDTTKWHPLGKETISVLGYSGASVASTGADNAQIVQFDFPGPAVDPSAPSPSHFCLLVILDSTQDPVDPDSKSGFIVDQINPNDNNVTHRNIVVEDTGLGRVFTEQLFLTNPTDKPLEFVLTLEAPEQWSIDLETYSFGEPFVIDPGEQILATVHVTIPQLNESGEVTIIQELALGDIARIIMGGMTYEFRPSE